MGGSVRHILGNGLEILVEKAGYAQVAAAVLVYRVGSGIEDDSTRGMSHFLEHMMFKGTPRTPASLFWQIIQRDGGLANAFTTRDATAYFAVVPSSRLEDILDLEADRMANALLDPAEVLSERQVVLEERRTSSLDSPSGALDELLWRSVFPSHPYRHPITGYEEDIGAFDADRLGAFYRRYYSPSNAILVVSGGIEPERVLELSERLFGGIPAGVPAPPAEPAESSAIGKPAMVGMEHPSNLPRLSMGFESPCGRHPDWPVLDMISTWLAGTRSSRLEELLVQPGLALDVSAGAAASVGPGLFSVRVTLCEGVEPGRVREIVTREIDRLASSGLPEPAMEEIRRQHRALKTLSTASPAGIAGEVCMGAALFHDPQHHDWLMAGVEKASAEDLARACSEWLAPARAVTAELVPVGQQPSSVASSPTGGHGDIRAPRVGDLSSVEVPASMLAEPGRSISGGAVDTRLGNGLRVLLLEDDTFPVVSVAFSTGTCSGREPRNHAGLAAVAVEALHYGTRSEEYQAFNRRLESLGADLSVSAGVEYASGATFVLSGDVPEALAVISDLLTAPAFRDADVGKVVADRLVELQQKRESPFGLALDNLARLMSEPEEAARVPDETSLGSIDASLARSFHLSCCRPSSTVLAITGSFDREAVLEMAGIRFGSWRDPSGPLPGLELPPVPARPDSRRLSMEGRHQTAIVLGWAAPGRSHPDHAAFELVNTALGDGIGSRLGTSIREEQGLAYQIGSEYLASADRGRLVVYLATAGATAGRALASVRSVVAGITSSGLTLRELELAKASMRCRHDLSMMDYESIAAYLMRCASSGRPLDYDLLKTRALMSVGVGEALDAARRWLSSEPFVSMAGAAAEV